MNANAKLGAVYKQIYIYDFDNHRKIKSKLF